MDQINFKSFFLEGKVFDFSSNTSEEGVTNRLGLPTEIEDYYKSGKHLHYNEFRVGISHGNLYYIDCFFMTTNACFEIEINSEMFCIKKDTGITVVLHLLNMAGIRWNIPYKESKLDYLVIETENRVKIFFYYENGQIERITRLW